jgi:hypothetical protein
MADVTREQDPKNFVFQFYRTMMMSQCHISFSMLTDKSQKIFMDAVYNVMMQRKPNATKAADIGHPEIRMLIESNDSFIMKFFWRRFYKMCGCYDMIYHGIYSNENERSDYAEVHVILPNGNDTERTDVFKIYRKGPIWKFGYVESGGKI